MTRRFRRAGSVLLFLFLWEAVCWLGWVPRFLVVPPTGIAVELARMAASGELFVHIAVSMTRVLAGYGLALVSGIAFGLLMGWYRAVDDVVDPLVELVRPVSPLAILPLAILWFGIGQASKIFVIWYGCFFPILLNAYTGVRSVPRPAIEAARTLGADADELLRRVILNHSIPLILTGARISFAVGMIVMVASEMINADRGLGYLILTAQQTFKTAELYVGIVTIALLGFIGDRFIRWLRTKLCPWYVETTDRTATNQ